VSKIVVWRWEEKNARGRWVKLRWAMDEAWAASYAEKHGVELRKIEGSREERTDLYGERGYGGSVPPAPGK
jgi:hypothetical protein